MLFNSNKLCTWRFVSSAIYIYILQHISVLLYSSVSASFEYIRSLAFFSVLMVIGTMEWLLIQLTAITTVAIMPLDKRFLSFVKLGSFTHVKVSFAHSMIHHHHHHRNHHYYYHNHCSPGLPLSSSYRHPILLTMSSSHIINVHHKSSKDREWEESQQLTVIHATCKVEYIDIKVD